MLPTPEPAASALRRFLRYVKPYWLLIVGATLCRDSEVHAAGGFRHRIALHDRPAGAAVRARARAHRSRLHGHRSLPALGRCAPARDLGRAEHLGPVQRPGGDAAGRLHGLGRGHVLPQLLGAAGGTPRHAGSAHRPVPAHPAPESFVLPVAPVGRHRFAPDRRHRAGAEFRRRGHDEHLDGRGGVPVLPGAAADDERPAHHRGPGGVPALHRLHAHLRQGVQAHLQAGAGGDGRVLRRHAGAHRRLHAGEEFRRRAARGARLLHSCPRAARAGDGQRAHHQPVQHASCSG